MKLVDSLMNSQATTTVSNCKIQRDFSEIFYVKICLKIKKLEVTNGLLL